MSERMVFDTVAVPVGCEPLDSMGRITALWWIKGRGKSVDSKYIFILYYIKS